MTTTIEDRAQEMYEAHRAHVQKFLTTVPGTGTPRPWPDLDRNIRGHWLAVARAEFAARLSHGESE